MSAKRQKQQTLPMGTSKPKFAWIALDQLTVYEEVQRDPPSKEKVREIADVFDMRKIGVLTVNKRLDGTFSIIDGQRRAAALRMLGKDKIRVPCNLFDGMSAAEEADMFLALQTHRQAGTYDKFKVGITANRPSCNGVAEVLLRHGWRCGRGAGNGVASCVRSLEQVWGLDGDGKILDRVVTTLTGAFGKDEGAMNGHLVAGLGMLLAEGEVDDAALLRKMRAEYEYPSKVVLKAHSRKDGGRRGSLAVLVREVLESTYANRKRRL